MRIGVGGLRSGLTWAVLFLGVMGESSEKHARSRFLKFFPGLFRLIEHGLRAVGCRGYFELERSNFANPALLLITSLLILLLDSWGMSMYGVSFGPNAMLIWYILCGHADLTRSLRRKFLPLLCLRMIRYSRLLPSRLDTA